MRLLFCNIIFIFLLRSKVRVRRQHVLTTPTRTLLYRAFRYRALRYSAAAQAAVGLTSDPVVGSRPCPAREPGALPSCFCGTDSPCLGIVPAAPLTGYGVGFV